MKKLIISLFALAMILSAVLPVSAKTAVKYESVNLNNKEAYEYDETLYLKENDSYKPVTVSRSESTALKYKDTSGNVYLKEEISESWIAANGLEYKATAPFVKASLKTYTRAHKSFLFVNSFYYQNDANPSDKTSSANSAKEARDKFKNASQFESSGSTGNLKTDDKWYVAAVYTTVTPFTETTVSYRYSDGTVSLNDETRCPLTLYRKIEVESEEEVFKTFTAASLNVDGLPGKILGITINSDSKGAEGAKAISALIKNRSFDIVALSEDFNYHNEVISSLKTAYQIGRYRGKVSSIRNNTDGLGFLVKKEMPMTNEKIVAWNTNYSTGIFGTGNGADAMIKKGYRSYTVEIEKGYYVDVYILHMDADSEAGDIKAKENQLTQLVNAIRNSNTANPVIVMGDTNCRYTREQLKKIFIDDLNNDERFEAKDAWIEKVRGGVYPAYNSDSLMTDQLGYLQGEIVDKIFYINNTKASFRLEAASYNVDTEFKMTDGSALSDHYPVVVKFNCIKNK